MRRQHLTQVIGTLVVAAMLVGLPTAAFATIVGSKHDLSTVITSTDEICVVCHTPHNADDTVALAPLWDHMLSTEGAYTPYDSTTLNATDVGQPSGISKLCLSCHDGTVAVDNFGGVTTGTQPMSTINGGVANFGTDLSNDHPISFVYDDALATADGGLNPPTTTASGLAGGGFITGDMLFAGSLECASCHDVHNDDGNTSLLLVDNAASALCLTCHDK